MTPKVSVIVPVYNSSKYIAKCCSSLFEQTLDSLQFIFVDDGCNDGSIDIVKETLSAYPHRTGQVLFICHDENLGVGAARNIGLKEATGDFIIQCDSDDWVEPDAYKSLFERAVIEDADIVTCGYCLDSDDGKCKNVVSALQIDDNHLTFDISPQTGSLFLKLIRRDFIVANNLQVPDDIDWGEDLCFSLQSLLLSQKTVSLNRPFYHHIQHDDSLTHTLNSDKCMSLIRCGHVIEDFLKKNTLSEKYSFQLNWLKFQLKQYLLIFPQTRDIQLWKSIYPECHKDLIHYNTMRYLKVASWLLVHHSDNAAISVLKLRDILSPLKNR